MTRATFAALAAALAAEGPLPNPGSDRYMRPP